MTRSQREQRLERDRNELRQLARHSDIFEIDEQSLQSEKWSGRFHGQGIRQNRIRTQVEQAAEHEFVIRLPASYPERPPEIRWKTEIFHPNISSSGIIRWRDLGIDWSPDLALVVVCERLWDLVRMSFVNESSVANLAAFQWFQQQKEWDFPVDTRRLRQAPADADQNIIRYTRKGTQVELPVAEVVKDLMVIDESTPVPDMLHPPGKTPDTDREDVFYIGDE